MATGNIKGGNRNFARPTKPSTSSATTAADTTSVNVSFTPSTLGPAATSYVLSGTSTVGVTVSTVLTTSPTTVSGFSSAQTYAVSITPRNQNGLGEALANITGLVIPEVYSLVGTYTSSEAVVIPAGSTKMAAYVVGAGGGGGTGGNGWPNQGQGHGSGGGGGGSGSIVGFKDFSVTAGQTVTITIGAGGGTGGTSTVAYGGTDLATALGGGVGNGGTLNDPNAAQTTGGNGGAGGTASSNVAGAITVSGGAGGRGAGAAQGGGQPGTTQASTSNITGHNNITAINPSNNRGGGGGGGQFGVGTGGTGYPSHGGLKVNRSDNSGLVAPVSTANFPGAGGGGGAGQAGQGNPIGAQGGATGGVGTVLLYIA